jgi:hypothetical protein
MTLKSSTLLEKLSSWGQYGGPEEEKKQVVFKLARGQWKTIK